MDQPNLARHVVERVEQRWAAVLAQHATRRPEGKLPGMRDPLPNRTKQTPEKESAQPKRERFVLIRFGNCERLERCFCLATTAAIRGA